MTYAGGVSAHPPIERIWACPLGCGVRKRTMVGGTISVTHQCNLKSGLDVPLQQANRHGLIGRAHHVIHIPRGDMSNGDVVQAGGMMAVQSHRPDGSYDTVVFAPPARTTAGGKDLHG